MMKISEVREVVHSFRIEGNPDTPYKKVYVDGKEIDNVRSATICYEVDAIPVVFLELNVPHISVDEPEAAVIYTDGEGKKIADV